MKKFEFWLMLGLLFFPIIALSCDRYNRSEWEHWQDYNNDCKNVRADLLEIHSQTKVEFKGSEECVVTSGQWIDKYTGRVLTQAKELQVDHIVPLSWAHWHGGCDWPNEKKEKFANDPENLILTSASANQSKSDKGPNKWMPSNQSFHCEYIQKWDSITREYGLNFTPMESDFFNQKLGECTNTDKK